MNYLQIDIYEYPNQNFLATRFAPYYPNKNGQAVKTEDVNRQVDEVATLYGKEVFFKTRDVS